MSVFKKALFSTLRVISIGGLATTGTYAIVTRKNEFQPVDAKTDKLVNSPHFARLNPEKNPIVHDFCVRKVPLSKIKPELRENNQELTRAFCAGVWSGEGYRIQRSVLASNFQNDTTKHQVWEREDLLTSPYDVGTQITDHFEVLEKAPDHIIVRAGDSPLKTEVRPSDGLFEMSAKINGDVVEFGLKSVFFQGLGKADAKPMPETIEALHRIYTKILMESAIWNCMGSA
ncbi:hypothetical protein FPQ18DRAFT_322431 [Pyronema domesticum]|uniref:Uncharacterized protein n=1 Tax=Pyronema omphalodes (strain CBS 100304) TaxID=1076935 RepID=U4LW87_PYROM|nr:hypothetical protein FPQ18DRAFT_322431 [Pyronema domesticum]CCX33366.1 Similar to conserved hypothetical protein [Aspergillus fumigatus Af293]; acc. no. XP_755770 [Pyronema omphalodes CBS 100304]